MKLGEIHAKGILSRSQVYEYAVNPYVGCSHGCVYCYAKFMKRFTGHKENWGEFVDVKINAPELVAREVKRKHPGRVWISGVCDPYQAIEKKYGITRRCVEILIDNGWPVTVQTKSPLVVRDADILKRSPESEVCLTITTSDEKIRRILEPGAPSIEKRIEALGILHSEGIRTLVMVAPILPGAAWLVDRLEGRVDHALIDRLNYHYADRLYKEHGLAWAMEDSYFRKTADRMKADFEKMGIPCEVLF